ncbi:MAG: class II aldolase/adducin family protein [Acholeplasmataceae bacterium]|nr:class II aldolase/adducin family protein [Acholeplasmataceae bacterium]
MNNIIKELINISTYAGNRVDYTQGGGGNTSIKLDDQTMIIKASGYRLKDINEVEGFVVLNYKSIQKFIDGIKDVTDSNLENKNKSILTQSIIRIEDQANLRPSVETGFHAILDKYVIHTHAVYANLINCTEEGLDILKTVFKYADFSYISIPYVNPGLNLSVAINQALKDYQAKHHSKPEVIFLANHGLIVTASEIERVKYLHSEVNERIRVFFGLKEVQTDACLIRLDKMKYKSKTPFIIDCLKLISISRELLKEYPLYPDQLVFLNNALDQDSGKMVISSNEIIFNTDIKEAEIMNESLFAFLFIVTTLNKNHLKITIMNEKDIAFINGWEAEKYRKKLAEKRKH